jgi:hypothetical protein
VATDCHASARFLRAWAARSPELADSSAFRIRNYDDEDSVYGIFVGSFTEGIVRRPADRTHRGMSVRRDTINVIPAGTR